MLRQQSEQFIISTETDKTAETICLYSSFIKTQMNKKSGWMNVLIINKNIINENSYKKVIIYYWIKNQRDECIEYFCYILNCMKINELILFVFV